MSIRFECQGSGNCCVSHGENGFVWLTPEDVKRLATHLGMGKEIFLNVFCTQTDEGVYIRDTPGDPRCWFLSNKRCRIYEARPTQCRTWPFWPENMDAKSWSEVSKFCPGVGKGPEIEQSQIKAILDEQIKADNA